MPRSTAYGKTTCDVLPNACPIHPPEPKVLEGHLCQAPVVILKFSLIQRERADAPDVHVHAPLKQPHKNAKESPKRCTVFTNTMPSAKTKDMRESLSDAGMDTCATVRSALGHHVHVIGKAFFAPLVESPLNAVVQGVVSPLPINTEISKAIRSPLFTSVGAESLIGEQFVSRAEEPHSPTTACRPSRRRSRSRSRSGSSSRSRSRSRSGSGSGSRSRSRSRSSLTFSWLHREVAHRCDHVSRRFPAAKGPGSANLNPQL